MALERHKGLLGAVLFCLFTFSALKYQESKGEIVSRGPAQGTIERTAEVVPTAPSTIIGDPSGEEDAYAVFDRSIPGEVGILSTITDPIRREKHLRDLLMREVNERNHGVYGIHPRFDLLGVMQEVRIRYKPEGGEAGPRLNIFMYFSDEVPPERQSELVPEMNKDGEYDRCVGMHFLFPTNPRGIIILCILPAERNGVLSTSIFRPPNFGGLFYEWYTLEMDIKKRNDKLSKEAQKVLYEQGTEAPFTGKYHDNHESGMYRCAGCGAQLFASGTKFDSGTGWPSFTKALPGATTEYEDNAYGMKRVEVRCAKCGGHLGHIFPDGPEKGEHEEGTGARLCINSCALDFTKE